MSGHSIINKPFEDLNISESTEEHSIKLLDISLHGDLQPRAEINQDSVNEYAEAMQRGERFPPVIVFDDGEKKWLADGYHRYYAALKSNLIYIAAEIRTGHKIDALKVSLSANATHGLRRSQADKQRAVLIALDRFGDLSNREIARMCRVDGKTVAKYRQEQDKTIIDYREVQRRLVEGASFLARHGDDRLFVYYQDQAEPRDQKYVETYFINAAAKCMYYQSRGFNLKVLIDDLPNYLQVSGEDSWLGWADFTDWLEIPDKCKEEMRRAFYPEEWEKEDTDRKYGAGFWDSIIQAKAVS